MTDGRVIEIRPARVQARYIEIGDMLVSSPIGPDGARPSRWIGRVDMEIDLSTSGPDKEPENLRMWRVAVVDGTFIETAAIPVDGFVWVHLPSSTELTGGV